MIGILLSGGNGSRLYPSTIGTSKQLLPVYDKPMIFYSLSILMLAGVRDIVLICKQEDRPRFKKLLGDGRTLGINIVYEVQAEPKGIADAFLIAKEHIINQPTALMLGDNVFFGSTLTRKLTSAKANNNGATIFGYRVQNPSDFGVVETNAAGEVLSIEEKPVLPKSNIAVTGMYFYDNSAYHRTTELRPSKRGELEISCLNRTYLDDNKISLQMLERGSAWLDTGTPDGLLAASQFVETIETRQGLKIACLEEIALEKGWIGTNQLAINANKYSGAEYGEYLKYLLKARLDESAISDKVVAIN